MVKADRLLSEAEEVLSGRADEAAQQLRQQARAAEEAAAANKLAAEEAKGGAAGFAALRSPIAGAVVAGAALAPIAVTLAAGLGGLGLAALATTKRTDEMAKIFGPLKTEVRDFQNSLQPQVLTIFGDGAGIAKDALKQLQPVAAATGTALHGVLGQVGAELQSGQWKSFFSFMAAQAGPDLQLVGKLLVDLLRDFPPLLQQLQPAGRLVLILADDLLKAVGGLERFHLILPVLGAAIGFVVGGPLGALVGGLAGVAIQAAATNTEITKTGQAIRQLDQLKPVTKDMVGFAGVAGIVAANMSRSATAVTDVQNAMIDAHPVVGTLRGDMDLLNAAVVSGNSVLAAYMDLWAKFVGTSVSDQQAVLNLKAAFEGYNTAVKQSGRASTAAQQAFLSIFTTLGTGLDTLHKNGASVAEINGLYATTFSRLSALHGLTPQQRADVQGLTRDYLAWASSADGLNRKVLTAAGTLRDTFFAQLANGHRVVPTAKADMDALADSVLKTGTNSRATASDRARLISDLAHSGLTAQAAQSLVKDFQRQIDSLKGKTVNVGVTASGSGGINVAATGLAARIFKLSHLAAGARIPGFGGGDVHPALLEGGETVVDKHTSRQLAPVFRAAGVPGYASGGVAGMPPFAASQAGADIGGWAGSSVSSMLNAMIAQYKATAPASGVFAGPGGGTAAQNVALAQRTLGWSGGEFADLVRLWTQESGWNQFAYNASSGATGIPQALPYTKMPRAAWLPSQGGSANVLAQETWGANYIRGRYGSPSNAWAHELAFNWYDRGGLLKPGLTLAYNGTGRPEQVIPPGRGGGAGTGPVTIVVENRGVIGSQAEADRWLSDAVDRLARAGKLAYALRHSPSAA